jgi:NAD+ kinase
MRIFLFVKDSEKALNTARELEGFLSSRGIGSKLFVNRKGAKYNKPLRKVGLMVVVGGDGTFLAGARLASRWRVPLVGINEGRFGFLTEIEPSEAQSMLERIMEGRIKPQRRMMLATYLYRRGNRRFLGNYLNDVVISKTTIARIMEIECFSGDKFMMRVFGDGVIIATPTGSTAYALSAGGPIVYPSSENFIFVPICPHTLSNRPMVIPADFRIRLRVSSGDGTAYLTMDGQQGLCLEKGDWVEVRRSRTYCKVYTNPNYSFFDTLRKKLRWG